MGSWLLILVVLTAEISHITSAAAAAEDKGSFNNLVEAKDAKNEPCLILYAERITGKIIIEADQKPPKSIVFDVETPKPADKDVTCTTTKGSMGNTNVTKSTITYINGQDKILLDLTFTTYIGGYWELEDSLSKVTVTNGSDYTFTLADNDFYANHEFSYSCNEFMVNTQPVKESKEIRTLEMTVHRLQVQPYPRKASKIVFHDSFDCSTWFTIPLWSGLAVSILLTAILAMGIYGLMMIKTPDRFESVKSKPLLIATSD